MEEFKYKKAVAQTYKTSNSSTKKSLNMLTTTTGTKQNKSTAITMTMSIATFFSRLTRAPDESCPETASDTCLL